MTNVINYNDFTDFAKKINNSYEYPNNDLEAIKTLHDNYSTFMVTKKYSNEYIKDMRMKSVIDNYEILQKC